MGSVTTEGVVGRDREFAELERFLEGAGPRALVLEGEPGIGKTTLWREGVAYASQRGFRPLVAQEVEAEAKLPFGALADLLDPVEDEIARLPAPQRHALHVALFLEESSRPLEFRAVAAAVLGLLRRVAEGGLCSSQWTTSSGSTRRRETSCCLRSGASVRRRCPSSRRAGRTIACRWAS